EGNQQGQANHREDDGVAHHWPLPVVYAGIESVAKVTKCSLRSLFERLLRLFVQIAGADKKEHAPATNKSDAVLIFDSNGAKRYFRYADVQWEFIEPLDRTLGAFLCCTAR